MFLAFVVIIAPHPVLTCISCFWVYFRPFMREAPCEPTVLSSNLVADLIVQHDCVIYLGSGLLGGEDTQPRPHWIRNCNESTVQHPSDSCTSIQPTRIVAVYSDMFLVDNRFVCSHQNVKAVNACWDVSCSTLKHKSSCLTLLSKLTSNNCFPSVRHTCWSLQHSKLRHVHRNLLVCGKFGHDLL